MKFIVGVLLCVPDWFIASSEMDASDMQKECLGDLILDLDADLVGAVLTGDEYGDAELYAIMEFWNAWDVCMSLPSEATATPPTPSPATPMPATATPIPVAPPGVEDDHSNSRSGTTRIGIGEETAGTLEYERDVDYFMLEGDAKEIYRIDVTLGTLEYSDLDLYDSNGERFVINEHRRARMAARLDWQAVETTSYYVRVSGYGTGSYTLTVTTVADDHGNDMNTATPLETGVTAKGRMDHDGDLDYFVFEAVEGKNYRISTGLGSQPGADPVVLSLYGLKDEVIEVAVVVHPSLRRHSGFQGSRGVHVIPVVVGYGRNRQSVGAGAVPADPDVVGGGLDSLPVQPGGHSGPPVFVDYESFPVGVVQVQVGVFQRTEGDVDPVNLLGVALEHEVVHVSFVLQCTRRFLPDAYAGGA